MALDPTLICDAQIAFAVVGELSIMVIDVERWDAATVHQIYDDTGRLHERRLHTLVFVRGGVPDAAARAVMAERQALVEQETGRQRQLTAVVTDSAIARGVLTAFGWLTRDQVTRAFASDGVGDAVRWLVDEGVRSEPAEVEAAYAGCLRLLDDRPRVATG